jgi:hypothetical protein
LTNGGLPLPSYSPYRFAPGIAFKIAGQEVLMEELLIAHFTVRGISLQNWMAVVFLMVLISIVFG